MYIAQYILQVTPQEEGVRALQALSGRILKPVCSNIPLNVLARAAKQDNLFLALNLKALLFYQLYPGAFWFYFDLYRARAELFPVGVK